MSEATLPAPVGEQVADALALATAFVGAPDGRKLDDPELARVLGEALTTQQAARDMMVGLLLLAHRLLDEADDAGEVLARAGLRLARDREVIR